MCRWVTCAVLVTSGAVSTRKPANARKAWSVLTTLPGRRMHAIHRRAYTFPCCVLANPWPLNHPGITDRLKGAYGVADATALRAALDPAAATRKYSAYQGSAGK